MRLAELLRGAALALGLGIAPAALAAQERSVTLADAIRRAERVQPAVVQARGTLRSADAEIRSARGGYLPTVALNSSGVNSFAEGPARLDQNSGQIISGNTANTSFSSSLSASVDLFTGFRRGAEVRAARASSNAAAAGLVDVRFQQALATTNQFFDALAARQLVTVRETSVRRAEEQLKVSIARLRAGSATRSDSLRSLVTLGTARADLLTTQAQLASAEANLARLIGEPGRVQAADDSAFYRMVAALDTTALRAEAEHQSPLVQRSAASATAARASVRAARSAYWPTLSLSGSIGYSGAEATDYDMFQQRQLRLGLSWSLFDGFTRELRIVQQQASADVADASAADAQRQVQAELTTRFAELETARARIDIAETSVAAGAEDLRVQQERYRLGVATIVDVLTSQESLNQAEVDVVTARFDYLRAKAQIEALIGRTL